MSTAGWIFLVGMRVIDLGALAVWLVWFFRQSDEPDDWDGGGGGSGPGPPPGPEQPRPGGRAAPLPDAGPWPVRLRDHASGRPRRVERRGEPARARRERVRAARRLAA